jgi:hypothetical protein
MADVKITDLTAVASVVGTNTFEVTEDPSGTPVSKKATAAQLATYIDAAGAASSAVSTHVAAGDPHTQYKLESDFSANGASLVNAANYSAMRTLLSLVPGTDVQAFSSVLSTYAGIAPSANVQTLLGAADFAAFRTSLSLVVGTNVQAYDADLATIAGLTATTDNFLQAKSSAWASRTPTQVTADLIAMVGDSGSGGTKGLVPAPAAGDAAAGKYLKADGTWATVSGGGGGSPGGSSGQIQYNNAGSFGGINWLDSTAGAFRFGAADAASPVAQVLSVQNVAGGTSNTAGADTTLNLSSPTGTGTAGQLAIASSFSSPTAAATTVTMTIAAPCVVSHTAHGFVTGQPVVFTTTGALPTGITAGTTYYVVSRTTSGTSTYNLATSVANAIAGTLITTSGSQSGTHTCTTLATVQNPDITALTLGPSGLTGSQTTPLLDLKQTWNTSGTPTGLKFNAVGVASNNGLLFDFQLNGASLISYSTNNNIGLSVSNITASILKLNVSSYIDLVSSTNYIYSGLNGGLRFGGSTFLTGDGVANVFAVLNGTTAQTSRLYRTFTNASNYERLALQSGSGYFEVACETAGTGTDDLDLRLTAAGTGKVTAASSITARSGTAIPAGGTAGAGVMVSSTANFGMFFGSGAPTLSAAKGSLYLRSDGSTTNDRAYINTDGSTTWTALTTAA